MSMELEPAGALVTASLVAKTIEGDAGKTAHGVAVGERCKNCNAQLAGAYCHQCGQFGHVHRSLLHLVEELVHGILHFDTRSWRTLPLLFGRPGLLTRRYIDGQRTRYVSPLALYLFCVFLMFFVFSSVAGSSSRTPPAAELAQSRQDIAKDIESGRKHVAEAEAKLAQAKTADDREDATDDLTDARSDLQDSETALSELNAESTAANPTGQATAQKPAKHRKWPDTLERIGQKLAPSNPTLSRIALHAGENPELTLYKLKNSAYKFAFLLIPISLPFLWLMFFWRKGVTMYDHAIFTLYGLSFLSLWWALIALGFKSHVTAGIAGVALLYQPVHLFLQLKETYTLGWFATLWRTIALLMAGCLVLCVFMFLVLFISLS